MGLEFPFSPSHAATASAASGATESEPGSGGSAFTFDSVPLDGDSDGGHHVAADDDNLPVFGPEMASADTIEDRKLKDDIRKDITRTLSVMHFFVSSADGCRVSDKQLALERVLYIFGKLNAGIRYVQGMNELIAPMCALAAVASAQR